MTALIRYEAARSALAEAQRIDEVKDIRDKAEAMAAYARQAKDTALIEMATEIKVRAEIRGGELLKEMEARGERRGVGNPQLSHDVTIGLSNLGITRNESSRWQKLAEIPAPQQEAAIETMKKTVGQVTTAGMLRFAQTMHEERPARRSSSSHPVSTAAQARIDTINQAMAKTRANGATILIVSLRSALNRIVEARIIEQPELTLTAALELRRALDVLIESLNQTKPIEAP